MPAPSRPFFLNLVQIRLPVGGWVSILHRVSGAGMSLVTPLILLGFMLSLESPEGFERVTGFLGGGLGLLLLLGGVWGLLHHLFAGLRHLGVDLGWGEEKLAARRSAWLVLAVGLACTLLFLWGVMS